MPATTIRYALDPTGLNPDNTVVGEVHTLSTVRYRTIALTNGAFFTNNCVVYDHLSNLILTKDVDYQFIELLQEATLKFGKEICLGIVITNINISNQVRINYQALGGLYQNPSEGIKNAYENIRPDQPIDWINVLNKPVEYPPAHHLHLMTEVQGFESLNVALERIRNAIVLSNIPAFQALTDWVVAVNKLDALTLEEIKDYSVSGFKKVVTFERLLEAAKEYNFNSITITPSVLSLSNGKSVSFNIKTTNIDDGVNLFWTIENITTDNSDFQNTVGNITLIGNEANVTVSTLIPSTIEERETFRLAIRKNSSTGFILAVSKPIEIVRFLNEKVESYQYGSWLYHPEVDINAESSFLINYRY